jgi:molybdate transport system substrate-binding protein
MRALAAAAAALGLGAACGGVAGQPSPPTDPVTGELTVFAAASLTDAYGQIGRDFGRAHPDARVTFNFAGSPTLVLQIRQGAPADVFASADQANMQALVDAGQADGAPSVFARNNLQIVVAAGNPKRIAGLADLARPGLVVDLCAPGVPCGAYARQALSRANVSVAPKSLEQDVKAVVTKVSLGEADAGIVYTTDVRAAGAKVAGVDIPADENVVASYPIVRVKGSKNPVTASAFVSWVLSARGQAVLGRFGFARP